MTDIYDPWVLWGQFEFDGNLLAQALRATFERSRISDTGSRELKSAVTLSDFCYNLQKDCHEFLILDIRVYGMIDFNHLKAKTKEFGASKAAVINTSEIQYSETFREYCKQNTCGKYGTNWMCPPAIKSFEECKADVLSYSQGVLLQTVYTLEDSFDYDGMVKAQEIHEKTFRRILEYIHLNCHSVNFLALNAGDCTVCEKCTYSDRIDCRFPQKAVASIEAYCIDVNALLKSCNLSYNNGPNTVSFVGMFLFEK